MAEVSCLENGNGETNEIMTEWSCKRDNSEFNICGHCQSCVLHDKLQTSTQWMQNTDRKSQIRFMTGIIMRCQSLQILKDLERVLQVSSGTEFAYTRSRYEPQTPEDMNKSTGSRKLHDKDMLEIWKWFEKSTECTKSIYLMRVFSSCDTHLLYMLGNLVHVLIVRKKHRFLQVSSADVHHPAKVNKSLNSNCNEKKRDSDSGSDSCDEPALTVVPGSSKSLSGVRRHKDFIRSLPVYNSKRILGLLDKASLYSCRRVSKHWQSLSDEVITEMEVKKRVWKQAMILQGNSTSRTNPVYAKICEVPVPITEEKTQHTVSQEQDIDSVNKGIETKIIQMEERNVYCGMYNVLILLEREDPSRVIHYTGGQLVAVGSKDRTVRLLDVASLKANPSVIQGHAGSVRAVLLCEERDLVISASYDLSIRCWNLKTGVCMMIFHGHFGTVTCLDLCGDRLVSGAKDCRVKVWNLLTKKCIDSLKFKHPKPVTCVKIDETTVTSSCAGGLVRIWDMETASLMKQINGCQGAVLCLCLDQWHILSGGSDGTVKAWSTSCNFNKCLRIFQHPKEVLTMSFLFLRVITGCMDGKIRIFNFLNGDCLKIININMQQSPVLSLHTHNNIIMVNTRGTVLMLQFAEVQWDYSASATKDFFSQSHTSDGGLQSAEQMTQVGSSSPNSLSTSFMQHTQDAQQQSTRAATCGKLQAYRRRRAFANKQSEFLTKSRSGLSAGRTVSECSKEFQKSKSFKSKANHTPTAWSAITSLDKETYDTDRDLRLKQSEKAFRDRVRKRGPHHPVTLDLTLLRINSSQHGQCSDLARSNMELNARVRDNWGPDSPKGTQHTDSVSLISKTPTSRKPPTKTTFKTSDKTGAPSTTHNHVDLLHPQQFLRSKRTSFCSQCPTQLKAENTKGSAPKHSLPLKVASAGINKITPLYTASQEDGKCPERLFMRRTTTAPVPRRCCHVDHNPLDPLGEQRILRTDTQLKAFIEEQTRRQQIHSDDRCDQSKTVGKHSQHPQTGNALKNIKRHTYLL